MFLYEGELFCLKLMETLEPSSSLSGHKYKPKAYRVCRRTQNITIRSWSTLELMQSLFHTQKGAHCSFSMWGFYLSQRKESNSAFCRQHKSKMHEKLVHDVAELFVCNCMKHKGFNSQHFSLLWNTQHYAQFVFSIKIMQLAINCLSQTLVTGAQ